MRTVRLAIFNEDYWSKGLIYTQNILPLKTLSTEGNVKIEIVSFTSLLLYVRKRKEIVSFCKEMTQEGIEVHNYFTLYYPTRLLVSRWFMIPFLLLNTMFYILYFRLKDKNKDIVYNLRSYQVAKCFHSFYRNYQRLIFDTRTDYIEECINSGFFSTGSLTEKLWLRYEGRMIKDFKKTLFISDIFKQNVMARQHFWDESKLAVIYNPVDYKLFYRERESHKDVVFLYTGSLGRWNKLETYLDFFKGYHSYNSASKLMICTNAPESRVFSTLANDEYNSIKDKVELYFNVPIQQLPQYYAKCDYGLQLMSKIDSRVGVKVVEYIASGVMPIIHENVQGAAAVARKYNLGIVVNDNDTPETIFKTLSQTPKLNNKSSGYLAFQSLSDLNMISSKLRTIYCD